MGKVSWKGIKTPERALQWKIDVYKIQNNMARGIFAEKGPLKGRRKTKRKAPDVSDAVAIFCGI